MLALAAAIAVTASWWTISALSTVANRNAAVRAHNGLILQQAKFALVGWVASQALQASEANPGRLPCPEAAGYVGTVNEGIAAGNCTLPASGRLPWRTLGLEKLRDGTGEPLWYVVSPGWALPSVTTTLTINSDTAGALTVDGNANRAVALIIAPGTAINVSPTSAQQAAGCVARSQTRTTSPLNVLDYLECENASPADGVFVTTVTGNATNPVLNDQVLLVTTADVVPALEAAVSARVQRDIAPVLASVYAGTKWGTTAATPVYPYATPFGDPGASDYRGIAGTTQGLLPFSITQNCTFGSDPRCLPTMHAWTSSVTQTGGSGVLGSPVCGMSGSLRYCYGLYNGAVQLRMDDSIGAVAAALRDYDASAVAGYLYYMNAGGSWVTLANTKTRSFANDGSFVFSVSGTVPNIGATTYYWFYSGRPAFTDHALLDSTNTSTGWFVRNGWYRLSYYAYASSHAAGGTLSCAGAGCLTINRFDGSQDFRPALLILAGRSVSGNARPSANLGEYLEGSQNTDLDSIFEQQRVVRSLNDRVVTVGPSS